jgi:RNA polymerase-interacting CarD/CdnL/TRCF family regulator
MLIPLESGKSLQRRLPTHGITAIKAICQSDKGGANAQYGSIHAVQQG